MKDSQLAKTVSLLSLASVVLLVGSTGRADNSRRIPRPAQTAQTNTVQESSAASAVAPDQAMHAATAVPTPTAASTSAVISTPIVPPGAQTVSATGAPVGTSNASTPDSSQAASHIHQVKATVDVENDPQQLSMRAIMDWQNKNLPDLHANMIGTMDSAQFKHKGLKAHLGGALVSTVGTVANAYVPMAAVPFRTAPNRAPTISLSTAHCPAAIDPAFQVPKNWWSDLSTEEESKDLGPEWKRWLQAVQYVFQSRAEQLLTTPGVAALHVIINPDGSIYNATPYTGFERANAGYPTNQKTMMNLRGIILSVGKFPPFPLGSRVPCYHLVVDGAAH
ncbi:MAG TPA: hypothetical protein V6C97_33460 [Oculatellaceae cyanobacterium]